MLYWIVIFYMACFAGFVELMVRAPELPWHD